MYPKKPIRSPGIAIRTLLMIRKNVLLIRITLMSFIHKYILPHFFSNYNN